VTETLPEAPPRLPLSRRARTAAIVLAALSVVLVALSVAFGVTALSHQRDRDDLRDAREAAVTAARQEIINLHTISYQTADADLARVLAGATGKFKEQFSEAKTDLKPIVVANKTVTSAQINAAGVVRADTDSATVLVSVDRTVKDASDTTGAANHFRYRVELEKHGGRWLVSDLQPVE
jgi:Mce-associated membrane protein